MTINISFFFFFFFFYQEADSSARKAEAARKREEDIAAGTVQMNGRELFLHEPWVFDNTQYWALVFVQEHINIYRLFV